MSNPLKRLGSAVWDNIGFLGIVAALAFCLAHVFDPPRLNWGDSGSDFNVMTSGRNFAKYGFLHLRLTPFLLDPAFMRGDADRVFVYTHYPQLPDLTNGVLRVVFGLSELVQFRFVALGFSFASLFFVYKLVAHYWSRPTAQIAVALWVANPLWLQHADYLHHVPYGAFFGFGSLFLLMQFFRDERRRTKLLAAGLFLFLVFLASYDWWFFGPLLIAIATVGHYRWDARASIRILAVLGAFAAAAVVVKLATNAWALGGFTAFLHDIRYQFSERATDAITKTDYRSGVWPTLFGRVERFFTLLLFPIALFWALFPFIRRQWAERAPWLRGPTNNPVLLLCAALPFLVLFREIWVAQYYPALLVLPFYAVGCAAVVVLVRESGVRASGFLAGAIVTALLANSIFETATFKPAFFDRSAIQSLRSQLDSLAPPEQAILVNHVFDAQYRYYFNRKTVSLILEEPYRVESHLSWMLDPKRPATLRATLFVQHKHLPDEMFDKGYYYILANYRLWDAWANPPQYHHFLDLLIAERHSALVLQVARKGRKLFESDAYVLWQLSPPPAPR